MFEKNPNAQHMSQNFREKLAWYEKGEPLHTREHHGVVLLFGKE